MSVMLLRQIQNRIDRLETKLKRFNPEQIEKQLKEGREYLAALPDGRMKTSVKKQLETIEARKDSKDVEDDRKELAFWKSTLNEYKSHPDYQPRKRGGGKKKASPKKS